MTRREQDSEEDGHKATRPTTALVADMMVLDRSLTSQDEDTTLHANTGLRMVVLVIWAVCAAPYRRLTTIAKYQPASFITLGDFGPQAEPWLGVTGRDSVHFERVTSES